MNCSTSVRHRFLSGIVVLVFLSGLMLFVFPLRMAFAHTDGALQLSSVSAGPYNVTVWSWPEPPREGEVHISIAVVLAEDASPVLDAEVEVGAETSSGDLVISVPATTEDSENKFLYEAVLEFPDKGMYDVTIAVRGSSEAEVAFQIEVLPEKAFNPLLLIPIVIGVIGIGAWLIRRKRRVVQ